MMVMIGAGAGGHQRGPRRLNETQLLEIGASAWELAKRAVLYWGNKSEGLLVGGRWSFSNLSCAPSTKHYRDGSARPVDSGSAENEKRVLFCLSASVHLSLFLVVAVDNVDQVVTKRRAHRPRDLQPPSTSSVTCPSNCHGGGRPGGRPRHETRDNTRRHKTRDKRETQKERIATR
eukprot:3653405-Rhodomonas_salina.5